MFDVNRDRYTNEADIEFWVTDIKGTTFGDADLRGKVDFADFLLLSESYGIPGMWSNGDFNFDGDVGFPDFLILSHNFLPAEGDAPVPEPYGNLFVVAVLTMMMGRRRGKGSQFDRK